MSYVTGSWREYINKEPGWEGVFTLFRPEEEGADRSEDTRIAVVQLGWSREGSWPRYEIAG